MNRRALLTRVIQSTLGLLVACPTGSARGGVPLNAVMTFAPSSRRIETAKRMINESGEMWLTARERNAGCNPILIAFDDAQAIEVTRADNNWNLIERALTSVEIAERNECRRDYRLAFYSYLDRQKALVPLPLPQIGQALDGKPYRLRAWIKNGRRPEWQMSIEKI